MELSEQQKQEIQSILDKHLLDNDSSEEKAQIVFDELNELREKYVAIEKQKYNDYLEVNKHRKIIGYNKENFEPIYEQ